MKIIVGSKNPAKINAVSETILDYDVFCGANVEGFSAESGVSEQPMSIEETVQGAINRAILAKKEGDLGIGIESGLSKLTYDGKERFFCFCVAAVYDGTKTMVGKSTFFELPKKVSEYIKEGKTLNDATRLGGLTINEEIGKGQGIVGILTNGRVPRKDYTKQALTMALIQLEYSEHY
jgi:inosine/xanthosine triphosphatase